MNADENVYDGATGTAGGVVFGAALRKLAESKSLDGAALAQAAELEPAFLDAIFNGSARAGISVLARLAHALRIRPIEFLQKTGIFSLTVYAFGLDPLYFLPEGQIRYDARIYMREINPRHQVPEYDMTRRNPVLAALAADTVVDALGKVEIELAYLLRAAVQVTGGKL